MPLFRRRQPDLVTFYQRELQGMWYLYWVAPESHGLLQDERSIEQGSLEFGSDGRFAWLTTTISQEGLPDAAIAMAQGPFRIEAGETTGLPTIVLTDELEHVIVPESDPDIELEPELRALEGKPAAFMALPQRLTIVHEQSTGGTIVCVELAGGRQFTLHRAARA